MDSPQDKIAYIHSVGLGFAVTMISISMTIFQGNWKLAIPFAIGFGQGLAYVFALVILLIRLIFKAIVWLASKIRGAMDKRVNRLEQENKSLRDLLKHYGVSHTI